jgi:hypothetical protein
MRTRSTGPKSNDGQHELNEEEADSSPELASSFFELHSQCKYCIIEIMIAMFGKKYKN